MRRIVLALAALALGAGRLPAQAAPDTGALARIRAEGLDRSRVLETAIGLSDLQPPRLAGSPGYMRAARWARDRLLAQGIAGARLEALVSRTPGWQATRHSVEMVAPWYQRLQAFPRAWSPATKGDVTARVVVARLAPDSASVVADGPIRGHIVLLGELTPFRAREAAPMQRWTDAELDSLARGGPADYAADVDPWVALMKRERRLAASLKAAGALAVLVPSANEQALEPSGLYAYPESAWVSVPAFVVARTEFNRMLRLERAGEQVSLRLSLATRTLPADSAGANVIAEIPGSDPALGPEVVMLGGHLDSWIGGSGATDNAAGCAVVMEVLRIFKALDLHPRRTVRIALWDAEETSDLYAGSLSYLRRDLVDSAGRRLPEYDRFDAYLNVDNGSGRLRGLWLQGDTAARPLFERLLAPVADLGAAHVSTVGVGSTDHVTFWGAGLPGFQFITDRLDYETRTHHTVLDAADYLSEPDLKQAAVVAATVAWQLANIDERVPR